MAYSLKDFRLTPNKMNFYVQIKSNLTYSN